MTVGGPQPGAPTGSPMAAVLWSQADPIAYVPTVRSLLRTDPGIEVVVGGADDVLLNSASAALHEAGASVDRSSLPDLVDRLAERAHVLLALRPLLVPREAFGPALELLDDPRVATVSFWCNAAGFLSFPHRNTPWSHQIESLDEGTITDRLRSTGPQLDPVPVAAALGPAAILGRGPLSALGGLHRTSEHSADAVLLEHSLRAQRRGFLNLLDPATYVSQPFDLGEPPPDPSADPSVRRRVEAGDPNAFAVIDRERTSRSNALATAFGTARAKVLGLRITIDGTCIGPKEMGTQVHALNVIGALADHPDVAQLQVTIAGEIPPYARSILGASNIKVVRVRDDQDVTGIGPADVAHRPFQPDRPPSQEWRDTAARTLVTIQDLIAYRNGAYHGSPHAWAAYRDGLFRSVQVSDGLVVISDDVRRQVELERLPMARDRTFVVKMGTDHLTGLESDAQPRALRGELAAHRLVVMIGANYAHKNRDLAIRTVRELRARGFVDVALVLAGASVPSGSSRLDESLSSDASADEWCVHLTDVTSEERNWLLRHASVVLYPTSAEGFGLVPFEAAQFRAPVVAVPFGPLAEVLPDLPVTAADWDPRSFADAAQRLLTDPELAAEQVAATRRHAEQHTWSSSAASLVDIYRLVLGMPVR